MGMAFPAIDLVIVAADGVIGVDELAGTLLLGELSLDSPVRAVIPFLSPPDSS